MPIIPCRPKWKGIMTDRERFNRQMHYKSVDRCSECTTKNELFKMI